MTPTPKLLSSAVSSFAYALCSLVSGTGPLRKNGLILNLSHGYRYVKRQKAKENVIFFLNVLFLFFIPSFCYHSLPKPK